MEKGDHGEAEKDVESNEDVSEPRNTSYPFLRFHGFSPDNENFHEVWMKKILGSDFGSKFLTNGLILELWSLVEIVFPGSNQVISPGKMSRRQFVELISCLLFRRPSVTVDLIKIVASKRDFDRLIKNLKSGTFH